jgi:predicted metalloprotease with PDZ domain
MKVMDVEYDVVLIAHSHLFRVTCKISNPNPERQVVSMPRWLPGSYLIRDFAKNIVTLKVLTPKATCQQIDTSSWEIQGATETITLQYDVYGLDNSVRGLYLDTQRCFFNPSRICLQVQGKEDLPHQLTVEAPKDVINWQIATTLEKDKTDALGFGCYQAENYDELIDHPVEIGDFQRINFIAADVPHEIVISGRFTGDLKRLTDDVQKICSYQINFFGKPAPFTRYLFILNLVGEGYGGLEHRSSTALQATRDCMPVEGVAALSPEYIGLLGLFSHEYFHAWNIKRIKPACFMPLNLQAEVPTPLLWVFEGFTTYYDDLVLVRSGIISEGDYLKLMSLFISRYVRTPGRYKQSLVDASFEAWTKFYQRDENSQNSQISYYLKGNLTALCLDLTIRNLTKNQCSLDDVMLWLWQEKGLKNEGVTQTEVEQKIIEIGTDAIKPILESMLYTTQPLPLESCLETVGLTLALKPTPIMQQLEAKDTDELIKSTFGVSLVNRAGRYYFEYVLTDSAAEKAGITANDELVAIDEIKVVPGSLEKMMKYRIPNTEMVVHVFRRDELLALPVILDPVPLQTAVLSSSTKEGHQADNLKRWLLV